MDSVLKVKRGELHGRQKRCNQNWSSSTFDHNEKRKKQQQQQQLPASSSAPKKRETFRFEQYSKFGLVGPSPTPQGILP